VIPNDAQKRVYMVSQAMRAFDGDPVLLVSFHDWSVWPSGQRMYVFDRFRRSYGETRPLIDTPGHLAASMELMKKRRNKYCDSEEEVRLAQGEVHYGQKVRRLSHANLKRYPEYRSLCRQEDAPTLGRRKA
jgi:hypothetical protein